MPRTWTGTNVFEEALDRLVRVYEEGHRIMVSFSAGKDSGVCLELATLAASLTGRLPVEVVMRDEEIMFPGTFEYAERVAERDEVTFHWLIAGQPVLNVFNREQPYWWVFDPSAEELWVRRPPERAWWIQNQDITNMVTPARFPPAPGKTLISVVGLRVEESQNRRMGLHSSGGYMTKPNPVGVRLCRPIYDWGDGDVWRAHRDHGWDYNRSYDTMLRMGMPRKDMRIAPPTMNQKGVDALNMARAAWPEWFDRVARRCPGVRTAADFGTRSVTPKKRHGETWQECYQRECIDHAPAWIAERSRLAAETIQRRHARHAVGPLPEVYRCRGCGICGSWKELAKNLYTGDPFAIKTGGILDYVEPEFFRPGAGKWGGAPAFA